MDGMVHGEQIFDNSISKDKLNFNDIYIHTQTTPASVWNVQHNLDGIFKVVVLEEVSLNTFREVLVQIDFIDNNNINISANKQFVGKAIIG